MNDDPLSLSIKPKGDKTEDERNGKVEVEQNNQNKDRNATDTRAKIKSFDKSKVFM